MLTSPLSVPHDSDDWLALHDGPLPVDQALSWAARPDCGAVVLFSGNARDHSEGRAGVDRLEYEAYESQFESRGASLSRDARRRWSSLGRLVMIHRVGEMRVGECAVVVVASAPHRPEAFAAARFCIDAIKLTLPIWKRERWSEGEAWGLDSQELVEVADIARWVTADGSITLTDAQTLPPSQR